MHTMIFESRLLKPRHQIWDWITSVKGISTEMLPFYRMTAPKGLRSLTDISPKQGNRLFRSYILLFGFLPIDYSDLTLLEVRENQGFVEQSPMLSMKHWRHERFLEERPSGIHLVDKLVFEPRVAKMLVAWLVKKLFEHRHNVLRKNLG